MRHWTVGHQLMMMLAALMPLSTDRAAVVREQLANAIANSDVIALAQVNSVEGLPHGDWKAAAKVVEVWKGAPRDAVTFGPAAFGDQAGCDASGATVGEVVVLFLVRERDNISDTFRIGYSGYGRLPVLGTGASRFVYLGEFFLPAEPRLADPSDPVDRPRVAIERLREYVKSIPSVEQDVR